MTATTKTAPAMTHTHVNVGCGPHRAAEPWVNLDVIENDTTHPDIVVDGDRPLRQWKAKTVEAVYLGHVLEHIAWGDDLQAFLADVRRVLKDDGRVCVVGPDVYRAIERFKTGAEPWHIVVACLEGGTASPGLGEWPGARHHWNCTEARVVDALTVAGFSNVTPVPLNHQTLAGWPCVSYALWQMAVLASK